MPFAIILNCKWHFLIAKLNTHEKVSSNVKDTLNFVITKTCDFCDKVANVVVLHSMGNLEENAFDAKLAKLIICMKHLMI
jgi:hypothetical protein